MRPPREYLNNTCPGFSLLAGGRVSRSVTLTPGTRLAVNMQTGGGVGGELVNVSETALTLSRKNAPVELERGRIRKVYRAGAGGVSGGRG
jgi:hypothetical protein